MKCTESGTLYVDKVRRPFYSGLRGIDLEAETPPNSENLFSALEKIIELEEVMTVMTEKGNAVVLSEKEYNGMVETIFLLQQAGFLEKNKQTESAKEEGFIEWSRKRDFDIAKS